MPGYISQQYSSFNILKSNIVRVYNRLLSLFTVVTNYFEELSKYRQYILTEIEIKLVELWFYGRKWCH